MAPIKQIILCGFGGQGIVLAGTILSQAAFNDGKWVSSTNSYGAAARGMWWWILPPGILIAITGLAFVFMGHAMDVVINPRLRR